MEDVSKAALGIYMPPFRYECGYIFDANGNMVTDDAGDGVIARVRGWGRISYMPDATSLQDAVGMHIAAALTEYWQSRS